MRARARQSFRLQCGMDDVDRYGEGSCPVKRARVRFRCLVRSVVRIGL